jgi:hypothetical protein
MDGTRLWNVFRSCTINSYFDVAATFGLIDRQFGDCSLKYAHVYELRPRTDKRGVDLISDVLSFDRL